VAQWRTSGFELSTALPVQRLPAAVVSASALVDTLEADVLLARIGTDHFRILDARAPERYRGEVEPLDAKAGHIPGAHNRLFRRNLGADGRFKSANDLRREFTEALDETPPERVAHQCGSGVTACHNVLAMAVAGIYGSLLYPGSWSEWSSDPARPVATGPSPRADH
jgi:thiosulfate/3-mercaptopyruvate sulfurtransferase